MVRLFQKVFLVSSISSKKRTKTRRIVVKINSFIHFLEYVIHNLLSKKLTDLYNTVLLYRGILSNGVFSKPKPTSMFYLKQFFHKKEKNNFKKVFNVFYRLKNLRKHLKLLSDYISTAIYILFNFGHLAFMA